MPEACCPACDTPGGGDTVLAAGQLWCPDSKCLVVSFQGGDSGER